MAAFPDLPEAIIHHIQSFLTTKESAQTALLSKSWRDAWFTRPTLVLDEADFQRSRTNWNATCEGLHPRVAFANKTFRRYKESKHSNSIHTLRLHLSREWFLYSSLATKWTSKALRMGATDFTLKFQDNFEYNDDLIFIPIDKLIQYPGLKSLTLANMYISTDSFCNMTACCPLIENLSLSNIYLSYCQRLGTLSSLGNLRSLVMCHPHDHCFHTWLLGELSSKFPVLKDLTLTLDERDLIYYEEEESDLFSSVTFASDSLEIFNFTVDHDWYYDPERKMRRVELHLPNIRKFTFESHNSLPELCFNSTRGEDQWESHLSIKQHQSHQHHHEFSTMWFHELSKFLTRFRGSKIHLCLHDCSPGFSYEYNSAKVLESAKALECLSSCEVEDVTIDAKGVPTLSINVLLDGLFFICRPKLISQYITPPYDSGNARNSELFQFLDGLHDLDEVNVLDNKVQKMDSAKRVRFRLKWKSCVAA